MLRVGLVEVAGVVGAAAAATQVKTWAEALLQPAAERLLPPAPVEKIELGADPAGHPENMPPAELADRVTGDRLSDDQRAAAASKMHWAMGVGAGLTYALGRRLVPRLATPGSGAVFGLALFGATHGSTLPALGLQHPVGEQPRAWWIWEAGSHVVYGAALEVALVGVDRLVAAIRR